MNTNFFKQKIEAHKRKIIEYEKEILKIENNKKYYLNTVYKNDENDNYYCFVYTKYIGIKLYNITHQAFWKGQLDTSCIKDDNKGKYILLYDFMQVINKNSINQFKKLTSL